MSKGMNIATALQQLGLTNTATEADVKQAYKDLARIWHPDRFQNDERLGARTEAQIKLINEARSVAMTYLQKYGHFNHVGRERQQAPPGRENYQPPRQERRPPPRQQQAPPKQKPEPKPREKPQQKPPPQKPPQTYDEPGFQMDQGNLVIVFIILLLVSFLFMLGFSVLNPPEDKLKAYTEKIKFTGKKSELRKEWDVRRANDPVEEDEPIAPESTGVDTFFTLGSDKTWVSEVQGPPDQIKSGAWLYGFSSIRFEGNQVVGWKSSKMNPLKIGMLLDSIWLFANDSFQVGSFREEVAALQGAPDVIDGNRWEYGDAAILFDSDTVVSWENDRHNSLNAR